MSPVDRGAASAPCVTDPAVSPQPVYDMHDDRRHAHLARSDKGAVLRAATCGREAPASLSRRLSEGVGESLVARTKKLGRDSSNSQGSAEPKNGTTATPNSTRQY